MLHTGAPGAQQRFIETFDFFFQAVTQQAQDRHSNDIPDLESYIALRRETSGCKPCWALIEYANNLDIPDEVMEHPLIRGLGDAANDYVSWSNVSIFLCEKIALISVHPNRIFSLTMSSKRTEILTI